MSAIRSRASFGFPENAASSRVWSLGSRTTRTPRPRATPSIVTSSWVGPTPPEVNTQS